MARHGSRLHDFMNVSRMARAREGIPSRFYEIRTWGKLHFTPQVTDKITSESARRRAAPAAAQPHTPARRRTAVG
eukprot:5347228-Prymnesium_polylepis.1